MPRNMENKCCWGTLSLGLHNAHGKQRGTTSSMHLQIPKPRALDQQSCRLKGFGNKTSMQHHAPGLEGAVPAAPCKSAAASPWHTWRRGW
jgi:hypothetical protein